MSRARDWQDPETGEVYWFDVYAPATTAHLELLADVDDLIDGSLTQKQVHERLNLASGNVPTEIIARKRARRLEASEPVECAICTKRGWKCEGRITKHHFVPRWMMSELRDYLIYAPRSICTIPICAGRHRELHERTEGPSKSIVPYLGEEEKAMAAHLLECFKDERPIIYDLIANGDPHSYEFQLVQDRRRGGFENSGPIAATRLLRENENAVSGGV